VFTISHAQLSLSFYDCLFFLLFLLHNTSPPELSTLSLHDALPICETVLGLVPAQVREQVELALGLLALQPDDGVHGLLVHHQQRSEEHTSELQSRFDLVCRLLLEKKNIN